MNIAHLQTLISIAEQGSFSAAALQLGVSQSAASRAIATLEEELGVVLLHRGRFGANLTPVGDRILAYARQMVEIYRSIEHEANLARGLEGGHLRVAAFRSAATHLLPGPFATFRIQFPRVTLSLTETDPAGVEQSLREGEADVGLLPLPRPSEFETWEIARDEFVLLLPRRTAPPMTQLSWADLEGYEFILYNYAECTSAVREHFARWGQPLRVAYEVREDSTIVSMVAQGLGGAILPRLAALPIPPEVAVYSLPVPLERIIGAAIFAEKLQPPAVFAFLEVLRSDEKASAQ
jgi:DNA-binding transcriptional LysR family regulator